MDAYRAARDYLDVELVRLRPRRQDPDGKVAAALAFNRLLGDPQRAYPSIQVAGTSGKGSVCAQIAASLWESGLRTGLHVSPYLQVFTEKTWINGELLSTDGLTRAVEAVRPAAERFRVQEDLPASVHGLASLGVSAVAFREAKLDVVVMETGVGGRFDLTQGLDRCLSVITDLGHDHPAALGRTIEQIAWHKAGIMQAGVPCVAVRGPGWDVLAAEAERVGCELESVEPDAVARGGGRCLQITLPALGELEITLPSAAPFQRRNAVVAAAALDRLARSGWAITPDGVQRGLARELLGGRFEEVQRAPRVVLDGAHNPQKVDALLAALGWAPVPTEGGPKIAVVAASGQRPPCDLLAALAPRCDLLLATGLDLYGKSVVPPDALADAARAAGCPARTVADPEEALEQALAAAGSHGTVLVTGSLYLVGRLRSRWYPWQEVLRQRTPWPVPQTAPVSP